MQAYHLSPEMACYKVEYRSQQEVALLCNACQSSWICCCLSCHSCVGQHNMSGARCSKQQGSDCMLRRGFMLHALICSHEHMYTSVHCAPLQGEYHCAGVVPSVCGVPIMAGNREAGVLLAAMEVCNTALPPFATLHNSEHPILSCPIAI